MFIIKLNIETKKIISNLLFLIEKNKTHVPYPLLIIQINLDLNQYF